MDVRAYNRGAWDRQVEGGNRWTVPVSAEEIAAARQGEWQIVLTPLKPVPGAWFPPLEGADVLCLASGGGQQGPILAAAGANVTVFDNSPRQLAQDRAVGAREGLEIRTVEGDMRDLSPLQDESFDLIFHPVSNVFVPEVRPVWREAFRVLRRGGALLAGFVNPAMYIFDFDRLDDEGVLEVKYRLPYSDLESLGEAELQAAMDSGRPLEFSTGALRGGGAAAAEGGGDDKAGEACAQEDGQADDGEQAAPAGCRLQAHEQGHAHDDGRLEAENDGAGKDGTQQQSRAADGGQQQLVEVTALHVAHQVLGGDACPRQGGADDGEGQDEAQVAVAAEAGNEAGGLAQGRFIDDEEEDADGQRRQQRFGRAGDGDQLAPGEQDDLQR
jgi:SAM-dependent methyltransferase